MVYFYIALLGNGIGQLIIDQFRYWEIVNDNLANIDREIALKLEAFEKQIRTGYPVRSLINRWMRRQIRWKNAELCQQNKDRLYDELIDHLREQGLAQVASFIHNSLYSYNDKYLARLLSPTRL